MRRPLYREAQRRLRDYIAANGLVPGDALPPEGDMARKLGISRLSLREATKSLETLGVVKSVAGRGLFVGSFTLEPILEQLPYTFDLHEEALSEVLQVREAMECGLIVRAREAMTERDIADLEHILDEMSEACRRGDSTAEIDRRFHLRLFAPLENTLVIALLELFWELFHRLEREFPSGDQHSVDVHRGIVAALRSHDPSAMMRAMDAHFDGIRRSLDSRRSTA
ncbi:MAG TPA: FCD domain-containing protein [Actinopolymorphaceae bacterium]